MKSVINWWSSISKTKCWISYHTILKSKQLDVDDLSEALSDMHKVEIPYSKMEQVIDWLERFPTDYFTYVECYGHVSFYFYSPKDAMFFKLKYHV